MAVDHRPPEAVCDVAPLAWVGEDLPMDPGDQLALACHGPLREQAVLRLASSPSAAYVPLYESYVELPEVQSALRAIPTEDAHRALSRQDPRAKIRRR